MKHIGILAHSFEGATLCFHTACLEGVKRLGAHISPRDHHDLQSPMVLVLDAWERGDNAALRALLPDGRGEARRGRRGLLRSARTIPRTSRSKARASRSRSPACTSAKWSPNRALRDGRRKVGILGTKLYDGGPVYPGALGRRGLDWAVPAEADRALVNAIIFDELCLGVFTDQSRDAYVRIIEKLADEGCDSVALVCTEIPLLITQDVSPLPILDSTRLLAAAAVEVAIGDRPLPEWRGGPVA